MGGGQALPFRFAAPWAGVLLQPLQLGYVSLLSGVARLGRLGAWLSRDHLLLFAVASAGLVLTAPQTLGLAARRLGLWEPADGGSGVALLRPDVPGALYLMLAVFLATFFLGHRTRIAVLFASSIPVGVSLGRVTDLPSIGLYLAFLLVVFAIVKLPIPRPVKLVGAIGLSLAGMLACQAWPPLSRLAIEQVASFQVTMIPMLWYSVYAENPPKRRLGLLRFLGYHYGRLFGAPVMSYPDLYETPTKPLAEIRFDGMKTLYVVVFAALFRSFATALGTIVEAGTLRGPLLALYSYVFYVGQCCGVVIWFNLFVGVLRLFGVPVRDNFNYWLLARTPNEHWQRWNLLLREWVVTFVFFPIMRARRALFLAVMAALLISGGLHLVPKLMTARIDAFHAWGVLLYWVLNGLAIYAVLKVPLLFPRGVDRLRIRKSRAWSVAGIVLTSFFYSVLVYVRDACHDWQGVADYLRRLVFL